VTKAEKIAQQRAQQIGPVTRKMLEKFIRKWEAQ
jgi:hypothetical protein